MQWPGRIAVAAGRAAVLPGGRARVGFEDNIYYRKGELATSNAQLVERVARISRELDRAMATPDEARAILGTARRVSVSQIIRWAASASEITGLEWPLP